MRITIVPVTSGIMRRMISPAGLTLFFLLMAVAQIPAATLILPADLKAAKNQLEESQDQIKKVGKEQAKLSADLKAVQEELDEETAELAQLRNQIATATDQAKDKLSVKITRQIKTITTLDERKSVIDQKLKAAAARSQNLTAKVAEIEKRRQQLDLDYRNQEQQLAQDAATMKEKAKAEQERARQEALERENQAKQLAAERAAKPMEPTVTPIPLPDPAVAAAQDKAAARLNQAKEAREQADARKLQKEQEQATKLAKREADLKAAADAKAAAKLQKAEEARTEAIAQAEKEQKAQAAKLLLAADPAAARLKKAQDARDEADARKLKKEEAKAAKLAQKQADLKAAAEAKAAAELKKAQDARNEALAAAEKEQQAQAAKRLAAQQADDAKKEAARLRQEKADLALAAAAKKAEDKRLAAQARQEQENNERQARLAKEQLEAQKQAAARRFREAMQELDEAMSARDDASDECADAIVAFNKSEAQVNELKLALAQARDDRARLKAGKALARAERKQLALAEARGKANNLLLQAQHLVANRQQQADQLRVETEQMTKQQEVAVVKALAVPAMPAPAVEAPAAPVAVAPAVEVPAAPAAPVVAAVTEAAAPVAAAPVVAAVEPVVAVPVVASYGVATAEPQPAKPLVEKSVVEKPEVAKAAAARAAAEQPTALIKPGIEPEHVTGPVSWTTPHDVEPPPSLAGAPAPGKFNKTIETNIADQTTVPDQAGKIQFDLAMVSGDKQLVEKLDVWKEWADYITFNPVTMTEIQVFHAKLLKALQQEGYVFADVKFPNRVWNNGIFLAKVDGGPLGTITVRGNRHYSAKQVIAALSRSDADRFNYARFHDDLFNLNTKPDLNLDTKLKPVIQNGRRVINADIEVRDDLPLHLSFEVANTGTEATNDWRMHTAVQHLNLTKRDDVLTLDWITSPQLEDVNAFSVSYFLPLNADYSLNLFTGYSTSTIDGLLPQLDVRGEGYFLGGQITKTLQETSAYRLQLSGGWLWQRSTNQDTVGGLNQISRSSALSIPNVTLGYAARTFDKFNGRNFFSNTILAGFAGVLGNSEANDFNENSRGNSEGNFLIDRFQIARFQRLFSSEDEPGNWTAFMKLDGQISDDSLPAAMKKTVGGADTVRGYREQDQSGDEAYVASFELRTPLLQDFIPGLKKGDEFLTANPEAWQQHRLIFLVFLDWGMVKFSDEDETVNAGETPEKVLASYGAGLRLGLTKYAQLRFDWGIPLNPTPESQAPGRAHFSLQLQF